MRNKENTVDTSKKEVINTTKKISKIPLFREPLHSPYGHYTYRISPAKKTFKSPQSDKQSQYKGYAKNRAIKTTLSFRATKKQDT